MSKLGGIRIINKQGYGLDKKGYGNAVNFVKINKANNVKAVCLGRKRKVI